MFSLWQRSPSTPVVCTRPWPLGSTVCRVRAAQGRGGWVSPFLGTRAASKLFKGLGSMTAAGLVSELMLCLRGGDGG